VNLADKIVMRPVGALVPYASNSRTHTPAQLDKLARSISEFGFTNPILVDGENGVIAGHARLAVAQKLGLAEVPTIDLSWLTLKSRDIGAARSIDVSKLDRSSGNTIADHNFQIFELALARCAPDAALRLLPCVTGCWMSATVRRISESSASIRISIWRAPPSECSSSIRSCVEAYSSLPLCGSRDDNRNARAARASSKILSLKDAGVPSFLIE
jgi:hypothetical protein